MKNPNQKNWEDFLGFFFFFFFADAEISKSCKWCWKNWREANWDLVCARRAAGPRGRRGPRQSNLACCDGDKKKEKKKGAAGAIKSEVSSAEN